MGHYYFVICSFPQIALGVKIEMTYEKAREMLSLNLSLKDWRLVVLFQRLVDVRNIRALWLQEPLDPRGNYGEKELEESLLVRDSLPPFIAEFLERYDLPEERLRYFPALYAALYRDTIDELSGFLKRYYQLEREIRLSLTALRAKAIGRDLIQELQFEDLSDPFVAQLLAQKDDKETILPEEYEDLKIAFLENRSEPKKLYRAILQLRLSRIEELEVGRPFTMDQVLGTLARLSIVETWDQLDDQKGREALAQVCR
jgi:hypothetical protein